MAIDEALLDSAGRSGADPVIRLYAFEPWTLSVGRFQRTEGVVDRAALDGDGIDLVRRPSGGQAVLHADELTYCVAIGRDRLGDVGKRALYRMVAPLLIRTLERIGVERPRSVSTGRGGREDPDCFASVGEYEIDTPDGRKLVGSAQMVSRTAVLQHGSIPLGPANRSIRRYLLVRSAGESAATNIEEQVGRRIDFETARSAFVGAIESTTVVRNGELDAFEVARYRELLEKKYGREAWTARM